MKSKVLLPENLFRSTKFDSLPQNSKEKSVDTVLPRKARFELPRKDKISPNICNDECTVSPRSQSIPLKRRRPRFDRAFKQLAVILWANSGKSAQEVGETLGIDGDLLYLWRKTFNPTFRRWLATISKAEGNGNYQRTCKFCKQKIVFTISQS